MAGMTGVLYLCYNMSICMNNSTNVITNSTLMSNGKGFKLHLTAATVIGMTDLLVHNHTEAKGTICC